ncbi:ion transporter [bacterium]|nr:ion transporter [candidate division CSSED10-310 bacterium]
MGIRSKYTIPPESTWRRHLHEIIFEADTRNGKVFDIGLLLAILFSVLVVMLESVPSIAATHGRMFKSIEWVFTLLFTVEYILRLSCVKYPMRYALSFFGCIDLLAILPTYLAIIITGSHYLLVIRIVRLLRVFRILKLARYLDEERTIIRALQASLPKITVFIGAVLALVTILGTSMYLIEGPDRGFTSIPVSIYWAVVTLMTVGYGDIAPQTLPGQILASIVMILGYSIIAVPTGIVTVEIARIRPNIPTSQSCPSCASEGHDRDARYCKYCGGKL